MATNRRNFLAAGVASLSAASLSTQLVQQTLAVEATQKEAAMNEAGEQQCLDYGLSFLCAPTTDSPSNYAVRF